MSSGCARGKAPAVDSESNSRLARKRDEGLTFPAYAEESVDLIYGGMMQLDSRLLRNAECR